jgi:hypothetical protein
MVRRIFFLLLPAWLSVAAHAALVFGPERAISRVEYAPPLGFSGVSAIASDGDGFLAVWGYGGIYASPISATGEIRLESQVLIDRNSKLASRALATWDGETYSLVWNGPPSPQIALPLMMARVSRDGRSIEAPHALPFIGGYAAAIASNGSNVLVAYWRNASDGRELRAVTVDRRGNVVSDVLVAAGLNLSITSIFAASDGDSFVIVWLSDKQLMASRMSSGGLLLSQRLLLPNATPRAFAHGAGVYELVVTLSSALLHAISFDGKLEPSTPVPVGHITIAEQASLAFIGNAFVVLWTDGVWLQSALIEPGVTPIVSRYVMVLQDEQGPLLVAANGRNLFLAWENLGALFDLEGRSIMTAPGPIGFAPVAQLHPAIATSGAESWIVWMERLDDGLVGRLYAARLDAEGHLTTPVVITDRALAWEAPQIVFTGSAYFVAWKDFGTSFSAQIAGRRLERDGTLGPVMMFGEGANPVLASNGTVTLLAFLTTLMIDGTGAKITGIRLNDRGTPIDTTPLVIADRPLGKTLRQLSAASNGEDFLVVWTDGNWWSEVALPPPDLHDIYGVRVMNNGSVDAMPIAIATGKAEQVDHAVASDGRDYVVVYSSYESLAAHSAHIAAKRVLREGQVAGSAGDEGVVLSAAGFVPRVARDSNGYVVSFLSTEGIRVVQLDGSLSQRSEMTIPAADATDVTVVASVNRALVVYIRSFEQAGLPAAPRAFVRIGDPGPRARSVRH